MSWHFWIPADWWFRRGNGTSMISLIIPPKDQVSRAAKMLAEEFVRLDGPLEVEAPLR
jgi:hypothetical protein